jgi:hypothetical protein
MVSEDLLPPSSGYRPEVAPWIPTTRLHGLTTQKTVIFIFLAAAMYFGDC